MKEQLIQYVELLFAGTHNCEDIKQEILQNTLDRYDDLLAEGKSPEAAYRLAIIGIGDINEILGAVGSVPKTAPVSTAAPVEKRDTPGKKLLRAIAVGLYILCPIPLIVLSSFLGMDILGLCGTLGIVAVATVLMMLGAKKEIPEQNSAAAQTESELSKSINQLIWTIGLVAYFIISFATNAWFITWVIFPLTGAVQGLVKAILDLLEVKKHEN